MCHRIRQWNQVGLLGQSGLCVPPSGKRPVAFDPTETQPRCSAAFSLTREITDDIELG